MEQRERGRSVLWVNDAPRAHLDAASVWNVNYIWWRHCWRSYSAAVSSICARNAARTVCECESITRGDWCTARIVSKWYIWYDECVCDANIKCVWIYLYGIFTRMWNSVADARVTREIYSRMDLGRAARWKVYDLWMNDYIYTHRGSRRMMPRLALLCL